MTTSALLRKGTILNDRYRIIKQIARGGFGRTYLAEDIQRYRELCVLKEFTPQVESDRELRKAEELFEREAGILYKLQHERIPDFEALLKTRIDGREALFLVQEYVEGESYWEIFKRREKLSEAEVTEMVWELLPVLEYIHAQDLIHRDISPDNLIRRKLDDKPVLIDFGCVKLAANAVSKSTGQSITLIGKKGYSPHEQLNQGQAFPSSDLYALAATAVVLLTGKLPDELYDSNQGKWNWQDHATVSASFAKILTKMLSYLPRDRYQSAAKVRQVLETENNSIISNFISRIRTLIVAPADNEPETNNNTRQYSVSRVVSGVNSNISRLSSRAIEFSSRQITRIPTNARELKKVKPWKLGIITAGAILLPGTIAFVVIQDKLINADAVATISLSEQEQERQQEIYQRIQKLQIDPSAFYRQVDELFYTQYPQLQGVQLSDKLDHQNYRQIWYDMASSLLTEWESSRYR
jgi:serine/threonine protein kinase